MSDLLQSTHFVVVTYNGERFIEKCIKAILHESPGSPIHVIDNGSSDKTLDILNTLKVSVHRTEKNLGFGRANNIGISKALKDGADFVFLINQDAYIQKGSLKTFLSKPESRLTCLHAFMQLNGEGSRLDGKFKSHYLSEEYCPGYQDDLYFNRMKSSYETRFANAAAWIIPRGVLTTIGGFNPSFFHYGEDDNYVNRLHFHGKKLLLHPDCVVFHDREGRPPSHYFEDANAKKRLFLLRISSPSNKLTVNDIQSNLKITLLKKRLRGSKKDDCIEHLQLEFLKHNSLSSIVSNRDLSATQGPSFLPID